MTEECQYSATPTPCSSTTRSADYIDAILRIAETAIRENFGKLAVADLEIVNSLNDKNDALLEEWLAR